MRLASLNALSVGRMFSVLFHEKEWLEVLKRDFNHPAIVGWCPFNETWDYEGRKQDDDLLRITYLMTKQYDATRPCIDTSGNFHVLTGMYQCLGEDEEAFGLTGLYRMLEDEEGVQYLEYIRQMERKKLDIMSEFLVMAATLLDIKCRMLLPKEVNEEGEEEDPRQELVEQLLEYKMYKYMSYELKDRMITAERSLYKKPTLPKEISEYKQPVDYEELIGDMTLAKLHEIFKFMLKRQEDKIDPVRSTFGKIEKDEIDMDIKTVYIEDYLKNHRKFSFRKLLEKQNSKMEVIVTFLVILELMKVGKIVIEQDDIFSDIVITSKEAV